MGSNQSIVYTIEDVNSGNVKKSHAMDILTGKREASIEVRRAVYDKLSQIAESDPFERHVLKSALRCHEESLC